MHMKTRILLLMVLLGLLPSLRAEDVLRKIVPGDTLSIRVNNEQELTMNRTVGQDGKITYWQLGDLDVKGKTPSDVEKIIHDLLAKDYIINPSVSVEMLAYLKQTVNVIGQVQTPGPVELPTDKRIDILDAIARAHSYTLRADKKNIILRRKGKKEPYTKKDLEKRRDEGNPVLVEPDDEIEVGDSII
jgi:protein involved in polysaccharide export with SLBB domain